MNNLEMTNHLNQVVVRQFPGWQIVNYFTGLLFGVVELFKPGNGESKAENQFVLCSLNNHTGTTLLFEQYNSEKVMKYFSLKKIIFFEQEKRILVLDAGNQVQIIEFSDQLEVTKPSDLKNQEKISHKVWWWHNETKHQDGWGLLVPSKSGEYFGVQIDAAVLIIINRKTFEGFATVWDISPIPWVREFDVIHDEATGSTAVVLRIQHEVAAYCRQRSGVWFLDSNGFTKGSCKGTTIYDGGLQEITGLFEGENFILKALTGNGMVTTMYPLPKKK